MRTALFAMLLGSAVSLSSNAALLLSADHPACKPPVEKENTCDDGMQFYRAGDGRCGCLEKDEFMSIEQCLRATIVCDDDKAETFTSLFQNRNLCGMTVKMAVGCGCFATYDDLPRE